MREYTDAEIGLEETGVATGSVQEFSDEEIGLPAPSSVQKLNPTDRARRIEGLRADPKFALENPWISEILGQIGDAAGQQGNFAKQALAAPLHGLEAGLMAAFDLPTEIANRVRAAKQANNPDALFWPRTMVEQTPGYTTPYSEGPSIELPKLDPSPYEVDLEKEMQATLAIDPLSAFGLQGTVPVGGALIEGADGKWYREPSESTKQAMGAFNAVSKFGDMLLSRQMLPALALGGTKPVQTAFFGSMVPELPEQIKGEFAKANDPRLTPDERAEAGMNTALNALILTGMLKHGTRKPEVRANLSEQAFEESKPRMADAPELLGQKPITEQTPFYNDLTFTPRRQDPVRSDPVAVELNESMKQLVQELRAQRGLPIEVQKQEPITPTWQASGEAKQGGQISFAGTGTKLPNQNPTAVSMGPVDVLPPEQRQEVTGPSGPYLRPGLPPTLEEQQRKQAKASVESGLTMPSGETYDLPQGEVPVTPEVKPGGTVLSNLQRERLTKAAERGATAEEIRNILRLPEGTNPLLQVSPEGVTKPKVKKQLPDQQGGGTQFHSGFGEEGVRVIKGLFHGTSEPPTGTPFRRSGYARTVSLASDPSEAERTGQPAIFNSGLGGAWLQTLAERLLEVPGKLRYAPNHQGEYDGGQLVNRLVNEMSPLERGFLEGPLKDAFKSGQKVTKEEVLKVVRENSPRIEERKLVANDPKLKDLRHQQITAIKRRMNDAQHQLEELYYQVTNSGIRWGGLNYSLREDVLYEHSLNGKLLKQTPINSFSNHLIRDYLTYRREYMRMERVAKLESSERAASLNPDVNPRTLDQMPEAVDLLVRVPGIRIKGVPDDPYYPEAPEPRGNKFFSSRYPDNGQNLVVHVRGYMDGDTFRVVELESDWARKTQALREQQAKGSGMTDKEIQRQSHPLISHFEELGVKAAINHARKLGAKKVAFDDAKTAMLSGKVDAGADVYVASTAKNQKLAQKYLKQTERIKDHIHESGLYVGDLQRVAKGEKLETAYEEAWNGFKLESVIAQEPGMLLHYDRTIPRIAEKLTGQKGELVEFGDHKNAFISKEALNLEERGKPRSDLTIRNDDGTLKTKSTARVYSLEKTQPDKPFTYSGEDRAGKSYSDTGGLIADTFKPMLDTLAKAGGREALEASRNFGVINDKQKRLYGELTSTLDPALKELGKLNTETKWLGDIEKVTPNAASGRTFAVQEGLINLPTQFKNLWQKFDIANRAIAEMVPKFRATGKVQRLLTNYGIDVLKRGGGKAWNAWVEGVVAHPKNAEAIGQYAVDQKLLAETTPREAVLHFFDRMNKQLSRAGLDMATQDKIAQDFVRFFPGTISHVKALGAWNEVVVSNPHNYLRAAAERTAHAVAFREVYREGKGDLSATREALRKDAIAAGSDANEVLKQFDDIVKVSQGHPLDTWINQFAAPDTWTGATVRMADATVGTVLRKLMLSKNFVTQIGETLLGGGATYIPLRHSLKAALQLGIHPKTVYGHLERAGEVNRLMYNWSWDPTSPVRSATRILGNSISKITAQNALNELQEARDALATKLYMDEVRKGDMSKAEMEDAINFARQLGFDKELARKAIETRNETLLNQLQSRASSRLSAGHQLMAERSKYGASRAFNKVVWFPSYWIMSGNQLRRAIETVAEDWGNARMPGDYTQLRKSVKHLGVLVFNKSAQGAVAVLLSSLASNGKSGVKQTVQEAQDDTASFLIDAFLGGVGGPVLPVKKALESQGASGLTQLASTLSAPLGTMGDALLAMSEKGRYTGRTWGERLGMLAESKTPISKSVRLTMSLMHLTEKDSETEAARSAFYKWRAKELGVTGGNFSIGSWEQRHTAALMRDVKEAIVTGKDWREELTKALDTTDKEKAARSLGARRLLTGPDGGELTKEQLAQLKSRLGDKQVELLKTEDAMVKEVAEQLREGVAVEEMKQPTGDLAKHWEGDKTRQLNMESEIRPEYITQLKGLGLKVPGYTPSYKEFGKEISLHRKEAPELEAFIVKEYNQALKNWLPQLARLTQEQREKKMSAIMEQARKRAVTAYKWRK